MTTRKQFGKTGPSEADAVWCSGTWLKYGSAGRAPPRSDANTCEGLRATVSWERVQIPWSWARIRGDIRAGRASRCRTVCGRWPRTAGDERRSRWW